MGKAKTQQARGPGHDKAFCGGRKKTGGTCKRPAGWGTPHAGRGRCKLHGGSTPNHVRAAQVEEAHEAVSTYGLAQEIDPHDALLDELHRTYGHVKWLEGLVHELDKDGLKQYAAGGSFESAVDGEDRALVWEKPSVWLELYHRERQHYMRVAKTCADVGIDERRIQLAERAGELMASLIRNVLSELGVSLEDPKTREVVVRNLRLIEGGAA